MIIPVSIQWLPAESDPRAEYARLRALVEVRLQELREALDRHEAGRVSWGRGEVLERVEQGLAELAAEVETP